MYPNQTQELQRCSNKRQTVKQKEAVVEVMF